MHRTCLHFFSLLSLLLPLAQCKQKQTPVRVETKTSANTEKLGGDTTVYDESRRAFTLSARNLGEEYKTDFFVGNSLFNKNWVQAPASATARDGLGPLFIARSCSSCHVLDGRGAPPSLGVKPISLLFRIGGKLDNSPHPIFGGQLQTNSLSETITEPVVQISYSEIQGKYPDGNSYSLLKPQYNLEDSSENSDRYGLSPRVAQAIIGLGLLESIPQKALIEKAAQQANLNEGISGRIHYIKDLSSGEDRIGRFGWKASEPSVKDQVAGAFNGDIGITSTLSPNQNHTSLQYELDKFPNGGSIELTDEMLNAVTLYCQTIAVPARRSTQDKDVIKGEKLFNSIKCNSCHATGFTTENANIPALNSQFIQPYTDLLLHDMGEGLADEKPDNAATAREWRTAPLWGLGLIKTVNKHTRLLHDGRARNIEEAILWHGGEAENSKHAFKKLTASERAKLIKFLNSL